MVKISEQNLDRHLKALVCGIGVRLAGAPEDEAAARYVADQLRAVGGAVTTETYPVNVRGVESERLEVRIGGAWRDFPCSLFSNTPGTGGLPVDAPLVFFDAPTEYPRPDLSHLRGKAVVHPGCPIGSTQHYRRLMEAQPAFLLFVDVRYPGTTPLADGMFPAYTQALGARPTVNVAYMDAWRWRVEGADAVRITVAGGMTPGTSRNVVAKFPGDGSCAEVVYVSAHHDTQAASPGADDNASGVSGIIELARLLAGVPRKRMLRVISFGAEEQLSVGSTAYVRAHRDEVARYGRLALNLDSYGSWMGWTQIVWNGHAELPAFIRPFFELHDLYPHFVSDMVPYTDHFPFVAAGVPSLCLTRSNCTGGRFFHHRPDDDMSRVSTSVMAAHLSATAELLAETLQCEALPFPAGIPNEQSEAVQAAWSDLFGGWVPPDAGS
jgi:aminopeptidase YwaD